MQKWEYLEVFIALDGGETTIIASKNRPQDLHMETGKYLDYLGNEGWEMVNAFDRELISKDGERAIGHNRIIHFKRPIE